MRHLALLLSNHWTIGALLLAVSPSACSSGTGASTSTNLPADSEPSSPEGCSWVYESPVGMLQPNVRVLATDQHSAVRDGSLTQTLISDGGDVYWYDRDGSVFVKRLGEDSVVELRPGDAPDAAGRRAIARGLSMSAERLYWGEAFSSTDPNESKQAAAFEAPGRLLSIAKQGGPADVLLELADATVTPISADAERIIVFVDGNAPGFYQVPLTDPQLEPLALQAPFQSSQLIQDQMYWVSADEPHQLLRSGFDDVQPEPLMTVYGDAAFSVGPGYVLSTKQRPQTPDIGSSLLLQDVSGCRAWSGAGEDFSADVALDAWYAYSAISLPPPAPNAEHPRSYLLMRFDLESGAEDVVVTPDFPAGARIAGQDDTRLFLFSDDTLLQVDALRV